MCPIDKDNTSRMTGPVNRYKRNRQEGKIGWVFLWLIGIPIPLLLVLFLVRGCT